MIGGWLLNYWGRLGNILRIMTFLFIWIWFLRSLVSLGSVRMNDGRMLGGVKKMGYNLRTPRKLTHTACFHYKIQMVIVGIKPMSSSIRGVCATIELASPHVSSRIPLSSLTNKSVGQDFVLLIFRKCLKVTFVLPSIRECSALVWDEKLS